MGTRRKGRKPEVGVRPPAGAGTGAQAPAPRSRSAGLVEALGAIVRGRLIGMTIGSGVRLYAAIFLGLGAIILNVGWQQGPKRLLEASEFKTFTARADGRIVESWLAIELEPADIGEARLWRASAKASPCAVVEYEGDWGKGSRRAFCGNRLGFNESYALHDLKEMAPGIAFAWARDASGFAVPEIRMGEAAVRWLASHAPAQTMVGAQAPATALGVLEREVDLPVDIAVESWAAPPPAYPLAFDPQSPGRAMPLAYVEARRDSGAAWVLATMFLVIGFGLWFAGTAILLPALPLPVHLFLAALPLAALPWWGDALPRYLRHLHPGFAMVVADMLGETDITGRLVASDPADAALAGGDVLRWPPGRGDHAETFGRIRFVKPEPPPRDADAALVALTAAVATQVRAMPEGERIELFRRLERDKVAGLNGAGLAFVPAAREAVLEPRTPAEVRKSAGRFLSAWVTQPVDEPWPRDAGFQERIRIFGSLRDVPISDVAILSASIAERAKARAQERR